MRVHELIVKLALLDPESEVKAYFARETGPNSGSQEIFSTRRTSQTDSQGLVTTWIELGRPEET